MLSTDPTGLVPGIRRLLVRRVFNNSAVLVVDAAGDERIALGKGIGFHRRQGDFIAAADVDRVFIPSSNALVERYLPLIAELTDPMVSLLQQVVTEAQEHLGPHVTPSILLPLADHIAFVAQRVQANDPPMEYELRWEVRTLYPDEVAFSRRVLAMVEQHLSVRLPDEEVTPLALHFANARLSAPNIGSTMRLTHALGEVLGMIQDELNVDLDAHPVDAARLVAHLRYLTSGQEQPYDAISGDVCDAVRNSLQDEYAIAQRIMRVLARHVEHIVCDQEAVFLALHLTRLRVAAGITR